MKKVNVNYEVQYDVLNKDGAHVVAMIIERFSREYLKDKYHIKLSQDMFDNLKHRYIENVHESKGHYPKDYFIVFKGVSRCSPKDYDNFSQKKGKAIAEERVRIKYLNYINYLFKLKDNISGRGTIQQSIRYYKKRLANDTK